MNQLIWRLHRQQAIFAGAAFVLLAALLLVTGVNMAGAYHSALSRCGATHSCGDLSSDLFHSDGIVIDLVNFTFVVPLLFGLFWGAPLIAKEFEQGTQDLAWTQGVTRRRWMTSNVGCALFAAVVWGGSLSLLVSWWQQPEDALHGGRFGIAFDITGIAPVAYAIFAVALGIAAGTLLRRVVPAIATTLVGFVLVRAAIELWLRPHFIAPIRHLFPLINNVSGAPAGAWILSKTVVNPAGRLYNPSSPAGIPAACHAALFHNSALSCLAAHGFRRLVIFQPARRFWTFQAIEFSIFAVLAAALVAFAFALVSRRDA
jgi:hypothetical protein